ncbi:uncharacterized protein ACHE_30201S [Aspergillus chevalieri]|uniref:Uncharacterized protein n=1 Tax=Aspergillus chevalieri TaxID=182096 RepID=A0A7R7VLP2_ASPCH|nr:uncharacterized protein ACHE_30201S [Aspergillus chevalieri]BCR86214.1 hypothetical protein ACHE_30201S [Aspergillus chevalieri]
MSQNLHFLPLTSFLSTFNGFQILPQNPLTAATSPPTTTFISRAFLTLQSPSESAVMSVPVAAQEKYLIYRANIDGPRLDKRVQVDLVFPVFLAQLDELSFQVWV